jgi:hypothetical protein
LEYSQVPRNLLLEIAAALLGHIGMAIQRRSSHALEADLGVAKMNGR